MKKYDEFNNYFIDNPDGEGRFNEDRIAVADNDKGNIAKETSREDREDFSVREDVDERTLHDELYKGDEASDGKQTENAAESVSGGKAEKVAESAAGSASGAVAKTAATSFVTTVTASVTAIVAAVAVVFVALAPSAQVSLLFADDYSLVFSVEYTLEEDVSWYAVLEGENFSETRELSPVMEFYDLQPNGEYAFTVFREGEKKFGGVYHTTGEDRKKLFIEIYEWSEDKLVFTFFDADSIEKLYTVRVCDETHKVVFIEDVGAPKEFVVENAQKAAYITVSVDGAVDAYLNLSYYEREPRDEPQKEPLYDYNNIIWGWGDNDAVTATVPDVNGGEPKVIAAEVERSEKAPTCTEDGAIIATAYIYDDNGGRYSDERSQTLPATGHIPADGADVIFDDVNMTWFDPLTGELISECFVTFECGVCGDSEARMPCSAEIVFFDETDNCSILLVYGEYSTELEASLEVEYEGNIYLLSYSEENDGVFIVEASLDSEDGSASIPARLLGKLVLNRDDWTDIPAEPLYDYDNITWDWGGDDIVTASVPDVNGGDPYVLTAQVERSENAPTCTEDGAIITTAYIYDDNGERREDVRSEVITATGHTLEGEWQWDEGGASATFVATCTVCEETTEYEADVVQSETVSASCTTDGHTTYVATVTVNAEEYSDIKTITESATGHQMSAAVGPSFDSGIDLSDFDALTGEYQHECHANFVCTQCGEEISELCDVELQFIDGMDHCNIVAIYGDYSEVLNEASLEIEYENAVYYLTYHEEGDYFSAIADGISVSEYQQELLGKTVIPG